MALEIQHWKTSFMEQVIKCRYEQSGHWSTKPVRTPYVVSNGKYIRNLWEEFSANIGFKMEMEGSSLSGMMIGLGMER